MARNHIRFSFDFGKPDSDGDVFMPGCFSKRERKIRIAPDHPINTSVFEEAIVLEENGVMTRAGTKEFSGSWVKEGELKPIVNWL